MLSWELEPEGIGPTLLGRKGLRWDQDALSQLSVGEELEDDAIYP